MVYKRRIFFIKMFIITSLMISGLGYLIWFNISELGAFLTITGPLISTCLIYCFSKKEIKPNLKDIPFCGIIIAIAIPTIFITISFLIMLLIDNKFQNYTISIKFVILLLIKWFFAGFCEEIGWRGVLLPLLKSVLKYKYAILINGLVWFIWHIPLICVGAMLTQFTITTSLALFFFEIMGLTFIMGAISETKHNSIWFFVTFHAVYNIWIEIITPFLNQNQLQLAGDGGYILVFFILLFALALNYFIVIKKSVQE